LINGKEYIFIKDYKDNILYRKSFNELTKKIYGFDFEEWYQSGYWGSGYIPYSLVEGEDIVANVSASIVDCLVLGERKIYIQIGTVMTVYTYQNQGLARYLMNKVVEEWEDKCDMIYLFANDSVLDFYPKFRFRAINEYEYSKTITNSNEIIVAEKLDMSLEKSRALVVEKINNSISISKLSMVKNIGLVMFYCTSFMSNNVYYLREQDVVVIAEIEGHTLYLKEIFSASEIDLDNIIRELSNKEVRTVVFGFTPKETRNYCVNLLNEEDTTLFTLNGKEDLFENNKLMFPLLSHA
jgi:GNAT superfamily N-acetyltransferase